MFLVYDMRLNQVMQSQVIRTRDLADSSCNRGFDLVNAHTQIRNQTPLALLRFLIFFSSLLSCSDCLACGLAYIWNLWKIMVFLTFLILMEIVCANFVSHNRAQTLINKLIGVRFLGLSIDQIVSIDDSRGISIDSLCSSLIVI